MSNDWWTSSSTFHTPQRPSLPQSHSHSHTLAQSQGQSQSRSRFGHSTHGHGYGNVDELDPEDAKMADNIKFLPSFANSPAGKMALGTSPGSTGTQGAGSGGAGGGAGNTSFGPGAGAGGGSMSQSGGMGSPGDGRRSPTVGTRFGSGQDRDSPRHSRRSLLHQNPSFGAPNGGGFNAASSGMAMDEDMPPTASLRDGDSTVAVQNGGDAGTNVELPTPQTLIPSSTTTSLHIFGPPMDVLSTLKPYLSQFGVISSFKPGPEGSNWFVVDYTTPLAASYALRRHGEIINGRWMVGFKVVQEGSTAGCTLVPGSSNGGAGGAGNGGGGGAGTPLRVQNSASIIKPKSTAQPVKSAIQSQTQGLAQTKANEYGWDEPENQGGWGNWVSERLFGR